MSPLPGVALISQDGLKSGNLGARSSGLGDCNDEASQSAAPIEGLTRSRDQIRALKNRAQQNRPQQERTREGVALWGCPRQKRAGGA
jgi:hypothetical protein